MVDVENELFLNLCTVIHSKHQYFNYSWEYSGNKKNKDLRAQTVNNNIEIGFQTRVFQ